ncbi:hypothetical protein WJX73_000834 [Symbiochloris irregularis]|uniref:Acetyl-coenzyme A synthetase n=1 Tax=Symbiochloris irregularis TaxID=706552 RepID=A0AAW1Q0K1_9CHLO
MQREGLHAARGRSRTVWKNGQSSLPRFRELGAYHGQGDSRNGVAQLSLCWPWGGGVSQDWSQEGDDLAGVFRKHMVAAAAIRDTRALPPAVKALQTFVRVNVHDVGGPGVILLHVCCFQPHGARLRHSRGLLVTRVGMDRLKVLAGHFVAGGPASELDSRQTSAEASEPPTSIDVKYRARSNINDRGAYEALYKGSIQEPDKFWGKQGSQYAWKQQFQEQHVDCNIDVRRGKIRSRWFAGGLTNLAFNCLDRHVEDGRGDQPCFLWEGNDVGQDRVLTYRDTLAEVCRLGNWLRSQGISKGDVVAIYMPMVAELPIAMLACVRIGAIHNVVFGGFSADALAARVADSRARIIITSSTSVRGKKSTPLKQIVDQACKLASKEGFKVDKVLVLEHSALPKGKTPWTQGRDLWWADELSQQKPQCDVEWLPAEAPSFLLYTSGSTGKPKGVQHSTGGFMVGAGTTAKYVFDLQPGDVFWCTADCGWITGHTYLTYAPLLLGATSVIFEGVPVHPDPGRVWQIVAKYKVRQLYTAPTLIRALEAQDHKWVTKHDRSSLKLLGTVGEPINPRAWQWFHEVVGESRCPIVDTWWQTETGMIMIAALPGAWPLKPGCATLPLFGVLPVLLDSEGKEIKGAGEGVLVLKQAWPAMMQTLLNNQQRFEETYFAPQKGFYFTGDGARRDEDGYIWITGRVDDVINVSGHRVGTAEVEGALSSHAACDEAAVVGVEHKVKGQGIYAFVTLHSDSDYSDATRKELVKLVREQIGAFAAPDTIHWAPGLPKTRSGKILRRVLLKIAKGETKDLGDLSSLADSSVVDKLIERRGK